MARTPGENPPRPVTSLTGETGKELVKDVPESSVIPQSTPALPITAKGDKLVVTVTRPKGAAEADTAKTRRGTSGGKKDLPRQRGKKKLVIAEGLPDQEPLVLGDTISEQEVVMGAAKQSFLGGVAKKISGKKLPKYSEEQLAVREQLRTAKESTEGVSLKDESDATLISLRDRDPEPESMPAMRTTHNTPMSEIFGNAPVNPLSPDVNLGEVKDELRRQITDEQARLETEGNTAAEPPARRKETAKEVKERLARKAGGEKANAEYLQKDAELGAAELDRKNAYFAALVEFQKSRSMGDALSERLGAKSADKVEMTEELKALKKEWVQSSKVRAKNRFDSVLARREGRGGEERQARDTEAVLRRFERRYVLREAVFKTSQEEASVRARALSERDSHIVEKTVNGFANHSLVKKWGSKALLGLTTVGVGGGLVGAAFTVGAGAVLPIPLAIILAGSTVSAGLRIRAELLKDKTQDLAEKAKDATGEDKRNILDEVRKAQASQEKAQKWASRLTLSGWAGGAAKWFTRDVVQKATRDSATRKDALGNIGGRVDVDWNSQDDFELLREEIDAATARVQQADVHLGYATTVGSIAGGAALGAGVGYAYSHADDVVRAASPVVDAGIDKAGDAFDSAKEWTGGASHSAKEWLGDHIPGQHDTDAAPSGALKAEVDKGAPAGGGDAPAAKADTAPVEAKVDTAPAAKVDTDTAKADAAPAAKADVVPAPAVPKVEATPTAPDGLMAGVEVKPGQGFGEMIVALRGQIPDDIQNPSPALEHVLNSNANALTHELEVAMDGKSLVMQPGDKFFVDNDQNIWFQQVGEKQPHLAFENVTPSPEHPDGYVAHPIDGKMMADPVLPTPKVVAESVPTTPGAASDIVITSGNEDITVGDVTISQGGGIVDPSLVSTGPEQLVVNPVDSGQDVKPLVQPEKLDTTIPATDAQAPAEAPKADAPAPAPEVQAPKLEIVGTAHPFADPAAGQDLNPNGVDLNKPQILVNEGRVWAHGTNNVDSYNRAVEESLRLAKLPGAASTDVYFVVEGVNPDTGQAELVVRKLSTPPDSVTPLVAQFGPGSKPVADLPDASKFTLPTKR